METKILVMYISVVGVRSEDIDNYVKKVTAKIIPQTFEGEIIILPTQSPETKIECINPVYILDKDLVREHTEMMNKLQEELQTQLNILKEKNNE